MTQKEAKKPTQWHDWLGALLIEVLTVFGAEILSNFPVTTLPPKADILLIRRSGKGWSEELRRYLPDGLRDCLAMYTILDLKYTESINADAFFQIGYYAYRYRKSQQLKKAQVQPFLLSARKPQKSRLKKWGYEATQPGVYHSRSSLHDLIPIISLSELSREPHNALFKCFAKDPSEQKYALAQLRKMGITNKLSAELSRFLAGLWSQWLLGENMDIKFTPDQVMEIGEVWGDVYLHNLPPQEILSRYTPSERVAGLKPEEVLPSYKPEEVLSSYTPSERVAGLKLEELFSSYKPEEIEAYLKSIQHQKLSNGA